MSMQSSYYDKGDKLIFHTKAIPKHGRLLRNSSGPAESMLDTFSKVKTKRFHVKLFE